MSPEEYEQFQSETPVPRALTIVDVGPADRTLAFGYTTNRLTWHLWVDFATLHLMIYDHNGKIIRREYGGWFPLEDCRPDKRVYPESVDLRFARYMRSAEHPLPLANFGRITRPAGTKFFGRTE